MSASPILSGLHVQTVARGASLRFVLWCEEPGTALAFKAPRRSNTDAPLAHPACAPHARKPAALPASLGRVKLHLTLPRLANLHPVPLPGLVEGWDADAFRSTSRAVGLSTYEVQGWEVPVELSLRPLRDLLRGWIATYGAGFASPHAATVADVLDAVIARLDEGPLLPTEAPAVGSEKEPEAPAYEPDAKGRVAWVPPFTLHELHDLHRALTAAPFLPATYAGADLESGAWAREKSPARLGVFLVECLSAAAVDAGAEVDRRALRDALDDGSADALHDEYGSCLYPEHPLFSPLTAPRSNLHARLVTTGAKGACAMELGVANPSGDFLPLADVAASGALNDALVDHDDVVWTVPAAVMARDWSDVARGADPLFRRPELLTGRSTLTDAEAQRLLAASPVPADVSSRARWLDALGFSLRGRRYAEATALTAAPDKAVAPLVRARWELCNDDLTLRGARFTATLDIAAGPASLTADEAEALASKGAGEFVKHDGATMRREALAEAVELLRAREKVLRRLTAEGGVSYARAASLDDGWMAARAPQTTSTIAPKWEALLAGLRGAEGLAQGEVPGFSGELRGYQRKGVAWMTLLASQGLGGCLADDMGLGKTAQVLASLASLKGERPALVVCPTAVLTHWQREAARFTPSLTVRAHRGAGRAKDPSALTEGCDVVVTSYAVARRDAELLMSARWSTAVFDEAQALKNPASRVAKLARGLGADAKLALTGTPVENRLRDLWSILAVTTPGLLGDEAQFARAFEAPARRGDRSAVERLRRRVAPFVLRRLKGDPGVAASLPPVQSQDELCELSAEQAALYRAVCEAALEGLRDKDGEKRRMHVLAAVTRLKEVCAHPEVFEKDRPDEVFGRSGKLDRAVAIVEEAVAEGQRALVFTHSLEAGRLLSRALESRLGEPAGFYHGGLDEASRAALVDGFQRGEGPSVMVVSLKAGGAGLDLTAASTVVHFDRWWNPAVEDQATARAHRTGQTRAVNVYRLMSRSTLEERIGEALARKRAMADDVLAGADEAWLASLDDAALRALLSLGEVDEEETDDRV
ncbi:MAG: SNF2-related protein [Polyangiales bacterium]